MATAIVAILGKIGEYLAAPVGRQFGYLFHFNANFQNLTVEVEQLERERIGVQRRVQAALNNVEDVEPIVQKWLVDANKTVEEAQIVVQDKIGFPKGCYNGWCLNLKLRYMLSREAKKKMKDINKLRQSFQFENVSCPAPVVPVVASSSNTTIRTRKRILDEIIASLGDDNINMIGICGMGGIGKTTMAKEVLRKVIDEKLFDDCAMAVVSQNQDLVKVQSDIAEMLGLRLTEQNPIVRESKLHRRLGNNRVLVILDDVWADFDLKVLGITFQIGCKVLFTSREKGLWSDMKMKLDLPLAVLEGKEAWDLFESKVRCSLEDKPDLQPVAKEIVKECGGLPLALVTVGGALAGKSRHAWKDTLRQLRMDYPTKLHGISAKVYQSLELSFNFLDEDAKSFFLLCCLFEEDFDIPVEYLVRMGLGLRLLRGIYNLEQVRDRVCALLEQLKGCSLLLPSPYRPYSEECIKMHDVVRDVAKSIALVEMGVLVVDNGAELVLYQEQGVLKGLAWISINSKEIKEFPIELGSSRLKLLRCNNTILHISDSIFESMGELQVLDVHGNGSLQLPPSFQFPSSLRTLYFRECDFNNITSIRDLPNLESLSFIRCQMKELPIEIGHMSNLVSLELTSCSGLRIIRPGVISQLRQLQELYMRNINIDWEIEENNDGKNASIKEFGSLSNLHTLHININDPGVLPRYSLFSYLKKYEIQIGRKDYEEISASYERCCLVSLYKLVPLEGDLDFLSKNAEKLRLEGKFTKDLVHKLVQDGSMSLKHLDLYNIDTLNYVANATSSLLPFTLEKLSLTYLDDLKRISRSPFVEGSFKKLKKLNIYKCWQLKNIFELSIASELVHLESLDISHCVSMEEVVWKEKEDDITNKLVLPKLERLQIVGLPRFIRFCIGIDEIEFPLLKFLYLWDLPQLECPFPVLSNQSIFAYKVSFPSLDNMALRHLVNMKEIWPGQLHQSRSFCNLTQLTVESCQRLRSVFTSFMAQYLVHLHFLSIAGCSSLKVVVSTEEEVKSTTILPKLEYVKLKNLPALEIFCQVEHDLEFPVLDYLRVRECPRLKAFSPGCVYTPNLNNVTLAAWNAGKHDTMWVDNVNSTLLHLYQQQQQQQQQWEEQENNRDDDGEEVHKEENIDEENELDDDQENDSYEET